jgi:hypothetical protein
MPRDDRRRRIVNTAPRIAKTQEVELKETKGYQVLTSRKASLILGLICTLVGLFGVIEYWGPKTVFREQIVCYPNGGNYFLIRTNQSFFAIDARLQHKVPEIVDSEVAVYKTIFGVPVSFELTKTYPGEKFYPVSTRYSYIALIVVCLLVGLALLFYPKANELRMYLFFFGCVATVAAVAPMIGIELTISGINDIPSLNCQ